ncbi:MAG: hypothetical protein LUQ69_00835 [Methanoregulaceae archaeon]|nr:hypothetical protein [Methanoregulaceae archaeon]
MHQLNEASAAPAIFPGTTVLPNVLPVSMAPSSLTTLHEVPVLATDGLMRSFIVIQIILKYWCNIDDPDQWIHAVDTEYKQDFSPERCHELRTATRGVAS